MTTEPSQQTIEMVFGFPKKGEAYGSFDVLSSNFDNENSTWSVTFAGEVNKKYAIQALTPFLGKVAVFEVDGVDHSVEFPKKKVIVEHIRNNPPGSIQTLVRGSFQSNTAFQNPTTLQEFDEELEKMTVKKPTKWFRIHPIKDVHSSSFRNKLWTFVTRRGESYGWVVGNEIYHRKGSLIMPYVKINKHVENAKIMYHTHPSKDEPSFSSADDIQWYLDAAYKWGIRHFYTIMANRLDHFEFKTKGEDGKKRYMKMDESKFIQDMDTMLTKIEEQFKGDDISDEKFCEKVTRKWIKEINERFKGIVEITYHSHINKETPLKNPGSGIPLGVSRRIALEDKHIATALGELRGLDYDWIHYGGDEFAHTMYVYWWLKYHFLPKADGTDRLYAWEGLEKEDRVRLREYLATEIEGGWTRADALLVLGLYHDIAKLREKEEGRHHAVIGAEMFKNEIAPELGLSQNLTDHLSLMFESDIGRRGIGEEEFKTIASDLFVVAKLLHMADRTAHHPYMFTSAAAKAREEGLLTTGQYGDAYITMRNKEDIATIKYILSNETISNPPPKMPYTVKYMASYEIAIDPDTAEMLFEDYDPRKVEGNDGKFGKSYRMSYGQGIYLRMPLSDGFIAGATLGFKHPANLNIMSIPARDDYGISAANEVYQRVGQILSQVYEPQYERLPIASSENFPAEPESSPGSSSEESKADVLPAANVDFPLQPVVNPKHCKKLVRGAGQRQSSATVVLAGPMGSGRREIAREMTKHGYQICPMHTSEPPQPNRIPMRDSVDHTKEEFMGLVRGDEMPYWTMDERGNCYGYTKEQLSAPKTVMYTSPTMALKMKDTMPHVRIIYIHNNQTPEQHEMKLTSRKGITPRQAKAASKYSYHQKQKASQFDAVLPVEDEDYESATDILVNGNFFPGELTKKYSWLVSADLISQTSSIRNSRIPKKYEGQDPSEHSDLYTDEDPEGTIQGLGFKDKETAERSVNIIKRSGKTHAHKIQAAMAMEQRARFHPNATPGIKAAQKVYANFIEEMKKKTKLKRNPKKTPEGRKIPKRYLKGLNKEEMIIAAKEIDKGYKYDIDDPKAYEYWKSDIKATARGYKTVPSKYKKKFIEMYGPLPEKGKFLDKIAKATGIKKSILQKVYKKGLAAWRGGHRPGVQQHQWAAGRVYSFVTLGNTVKKGNKKMPDHSLAIEAGLIKANPTKKDKPTLEEFRQWVSQVNMKNKEIKAFMESDWFDEAGLTPKEAKEQGIKSGQDSLRAIVRMRKKLGITGPKDYIKSGPLTTKKYYQIALKEWTGLDNSVPLLDDLTDWGWMKRQNRFNGRAAAYPYNKAAEKRRGPLVKKQKTQNKPSRKLLSLWVWGHDPWRWARKNGVANMPKCPDVPWIGMTEKRKYGKIPVLMSPNVKKNPEVVIPPFGLAFVPQSEVKGILKDGVEAEAGVIPLVYPYPNWKGKILPWLYETVKEIPMKDIALLKINHPLSQGKKIDSDIIYYHKGDIKPSQIENIKDWWDSIDFESGQITDTKEYREWMDDSGIELILTIKQNPSFNVEGITFFTSIPTVKYKNLGAVSAEIEVDRNIPKELVGNVKDIFLGLVEDYEKKTDERVALALAYAIDDISIEAKKRGGNAIINLTVETGGSIGLPIVEFNKTIPATIIVTGDVAKIGKTKSNPPKMLDKLRGMMYHGSNISNIKALKPNYNHLVGREVVFATPNYEYALAMGVDSSNDDLEIGYINGKFTIAEVYEGAFELLKQPVYMYKVKGKGFHQHPRLPEMEYIIETSMPVQGAKRIPNAYQELKRIGTTFIPYR